MHVSTMADDYYRFVEQAHMLRGENTGKVYRLGDKVRGAGRPGRHGAAADRSRAWSRSSNGCASPKRKRGPRRSKAEPRREAAVQPRSAQAATSAQRRKPRPGGRSERRETEAMSRRSIVVGTAGHIDHGKSALVRALTGTDPDRLKEEKARGITIDLGFAHVAVERHRPCRSWTCPGHERFVKNMLAGVGGIDLVLLVVAADESVMPQTREHFDICRLLHVPRRADRPDQDATSPTPTCRSWPRSRCAS